MSSKYLDYRDSISLAAIQNGWGKAGDDHFVSPNNKYWLKWRWPIWRVFQRYEHSGNFMHAEDYPLETKLDLVEVIAIEGRVK